MTGWVLPTLFLFTSLSLVAQEAAAQSIPERFLGVWQNMEGQDRTCSASDWNSDRHSDTHIRISRGRFEAHEQACRVVSIQQPDGDDDFATLRVQLACNVEGMKETRTQVWQLQPIRGQRWLSVASLARVTTYVNLYQHCPAEPSAAIASAADSAPAKAPADPPAISSAPQGDDYRNLPQAIRKEVEAVREQCREMQAANSTDMQGIRYIRLRGQQGTEPAIVVDNLELCDGDQTGANCDNRGSCPLQIWTMRRDGTWATILNDPVFERAFEIEASSGVFFSLSIVLSAELAQCSPRRGAVFNKGDACRATGQYQNGKWSWKKVEDLRN